MFTTEEIAALMAHCGYMEAVTDGRTMRGLEIKGFWGALGMKLEPMVHYRQCCQCLNLFDSRAEHACVCDCVTSTENEQLRAKVKTWEEFDFDRDSPDRLAEHVLALMVERDRMQRRAEESEAVLAAMHRAAPPEASEVPE